MMAEIGEKRPLVTNDASSNLRKKCKKETDADLKKVAEMVLVLSAMGKMRGGVGPTAVEKELMGEARSMLGKVCEGFAPKDLFPKEAFTGLIDDLGLNKVNEQRIGFRAQMRFSIADRLKESKEKVTVRNLDTALRKGKGQAVFICGHPHPTLATARECLARWMEKAEKISLQSTPQSAQRLQVSSGAAVDSHTQSVQKSHLGNSNRKSISASPLSHVTPSSSTAPSTYQLPTSEIRPTVSTASHSSHLGVAVLPRVNRPPPNVPVHHSQVQVTVNHSANSATRTPTWTVQHHPAQPANVGSNNKVPINMSLGVGGPTNVKSGLPSQAASRTVITQTTRPPSQGTNYAHPLPVQNAHTETAKIVQKLLQPKVSDRPIWDPPSRDYMNKALTCQMCTSMVTDTDSVLVCDVCEKGYHLKCLQMTYQKSFAGEEWHCGRCLSLSNGKPLPPKYGRVLRNTNTPKMSDSPANLSTKKIDASDAKGDNTSENVPTSVAASKPGSAGDDVKGIKGSGNDSSKGKRDEMSNMVNSPLSACVSSMDSSAENVPTGVASDKSGSKRDDAEEIKESADDSSNAKWVDTTNMVNTSLSGSVSSKDSSGEKLHSDNKTADMVPSSSAKSNLAPNSSEKSLVLVNGLPNNEANPILQADDTVPSSSARSNLVPDSLEKSQEMVNVLPNDEASPSMQSVDMVPNSSAKSSLLPDSSENFKAMVDGLLNDEGSLPMQSVDTVPSSSAKSNLVPDSSEKSQEMVTGLPNDGVSPSIQYLENNMVVEDSEDTHCDENLKNAHQSKDTAQEVKCDIPSKFAICTGVVDRGESSPGGFRAVSWVGDPTQVLDEKIYYDTVCVNEHLYKAMDYVLVRFEDQKIVPSKLQAMWEDKNTAVKWVTVNRCYFPGDLPEAVGRPCGLQSREVYESTKCTLSMASLIESPCEVLHPRKFEEEIERRSLSGTQPNDSLPQIFLCKWIYDEVKGLFRDISY